jgi:integrase
MFNEQEVAALLAAPDQARWIGRRDHAPMTLTIQTGLRVSELIALRCQDAHLASASHIQAPTRSPRRRPDDDAKLRSHREASPAVVESERLERAQSLRNPDLEIWLDDAKAIAEQISSHGARYENHHALVSQMLRAVLCAR